MSLALSQLLLKVEERKVLRTSSRFPNRPLTKTCYCSVTIRVQLFATPWTATRQASLSITNSRSLLKLMSVESVMPSNHLLLCHPLLPPSIFPSIRVFSNESVLLIRWPKDWSFCVCTYGQLANGNRQVSCQYLHVLPKQVKKAVFIFFLYHVYNYYSHTVC